MEYENGQFTKQDINNLNLLDLQRMAQVLSMISSIIGYVATVEGIEIIYNKYNSNKTDIPNPDVTAIISIYFLIASRLIISQIGLSRYQYLYEKYINGEIDYSLEPNENINISNMLAILSQYYALSGAFGIYDRDLNQPIFGF